MSYISRHFANNKFTYRGAIKEDLERIKGLKIPPMWTNVKIDKSSKAKIQATGYDSKGRKQYIYHKDFIEKSKLKKFNKIKTFNYDKYASVIKRHMNKRDLSKECVIANIVKMMEDLNIRVGNENYKKENGSYGITTLLKKHHKNNVLTFVGKKGVAHIKYITNPLSISFIKRVNSIKGPNLFYYQPNKCVTSSDLNAFLKKEVQEGITCKDIRTYCANKIFNKFMANVKLPENIKERKRNVLKGIDYTAKELGNTRKVCKDSYLCPSTLKKYL